MKRFALLALGAVLLAPAGAAQAEEVRSYSASVAAVPAKPDDGMTTWLLLAESALTEDKLAALHDCLEPDQIAGIVGGLARKLQTAAMPAEANRPWRSCGEHGCP